MEKEGVKFPILQLEGLKGNLFPGGSVWFLYKTPYEAGLTSVTWYVTVLLDAAVTELRPERWFQLTRLSPTLSLSHKRPR